MRKLNLNVRKVGKVGVFHDMTGIEIYGILINDIDDNYSLLWLCAEKREIQNLMSSMACDENE